MTTARTVLRMVENTVRDRHRVDDEFACAAPSRDGLKAEDPKTGGGDHRRREDSHGDRFRFSGHHQASDHLPGPTLAELPELTTTSRSTALKQPGLTPIRFIRTMNINGKIL